MEYLSSLLKSNPNTQDISLKGRNIKNLDRLLPFLSKFEKLTSLDLSENMLSELPDLSNLQSLIHLNINMNTFPSILPVLEKLKTVPGLTSLCMNLETNSEVKIVLESLPNLKSLNFQNISPNDLDELNQQPSTTLENFHSQQNQIETNNSPPKETLENFQPEFLEEVNLGQGAIDNLKDLFNRLNSFISIKTGNKINLESEYEGFVTKIIQKTYQDIQNAKSQSSKNAYVFLAISIINEYISNHFIDSLSNSDLSSSNLLRTINEMFISVIKGLLSQSLNSYLYKEVEDISKKSTAELNQIEKMKIESEAELNQKRTEIEKMKIKFDEDKKDLLSRIEELELELSIYKQNPHSKIVDSSSPKLYKEEKELILDKINEEEVIQNDENVNQPILPKQMKPIRYSQNKEESSKELTLNQLKELINDIFNQKVKFDKKCKDNKMPKQTMEQYMYNYLNQRYGLKTLIIEWASSIINGIKKYGNIDNDVALFGKILRNECDEDFRFILSQLKIALSELLKEKIQNKYRAKTEDEIEKMCKKIENGFLEDTAWTDIARRMYIKEHAQIIEMKTKQFIEEEKEKEQNKEKLDIKRKSRETEVPILQYKIRFKDFQKIILDFQLKSHEMYLKSFIDLFKQIDADTNGILNEEEFKLLLYKMNVCNDEAEVTRLLKIIDPNCNEQITFSECLALFSSELFKFKPANNSNVKQLSLLDKFIAEHKDNLT